MWMSLKKPQTNNACIPDRIKEMHFGAVDKKIRVYKNAINKIPDRPINTPS